MRKPCHNLINNRAKTNIQIKVRSAGLLWWGNAYCGIKFSTKSHFPRPESISNFGLGTHFANDIWFSSTPVAMNSQCLGVPLQCILNSLLFNQRWEKTQLYEEYWASETHYASASLHKCRLKNDWSARWCSDICRSRSVGQIRNSTVYHWQRAVSCFELIAKPAWRRRIKSIYSRFHERRT